MIRKLLTLATLAVFGLLWMPTMASAANPAYPAPPVTPETVVPATADVVSTGATTGQVTSLASTGTGFNVGLVVWIAVAVLVVGLGLLIVGHRSRKSGSAR